MQKQSLLVLSVALPLVFQAACAEAESTPEEVVEKVYEGKLTVAQAQSNCGCQLETVKLAGTVFHFGLDLSQNPPTPYPFQSTVPGVRVWIAEAPITRLLNLRTDVQGHWDISAVKLKGRPLAVSFVYEAAGYPTTKSQVFDIGDRAITDLSVQLPTDAYYAAAKGQIEQQIGGLIGAPYTLRNVVVTTVGKSWASMYNPALPHGDPGVQVSISPAIQFPASLGPVYFNESVSPDPTYTRTSVDGGVLFGNIPSGTYTLSASKAPFTYTSAKFSIEDRIGLYVASPPHGLQSSNSSGPGQP